VTKIDDHEALLGEAYDWLIRLTSGAATVDDAKALKEWLSRGPAHEQAFCKANALWEQIGYAPAHCDVATVNGPRPALIGMGRRAVLTGAVAASVAGWLVVRPPMQLWPSWPELAADYRTGAGERKQIGVAGGVVDLNTRTSLVLQSGQGPDAVALIAGEVAVAARSGPFGVVAAGGRTVGSAASFNVRLDEQTVCSTCLEGEVSVEYQGRRATVRRGQQVRYGGRELTEAMTIDPVIVTAWHRGMLVLHNEPLSRVVEEVNRYRPGRIFLLDRTLGKRQIDVSLRLDRIDDVIVLVHDIYGAHVTRLPGGVVLLS
jgi:transmembrane sensor